MAQAAGARVVALAGSVTLDDAALAALGIDAALPLASGPLSLAESMAQARPLLAQAARRALRLMRVGASLPPLA
jgi:glycerate kinase